MKLISDKERQKLLAEARRMAAAVHFETGLTFRAAETAEREAIKHERMRLRGLAELFHLKHGRKPATATHTAQIIPFPINRRLGRC